VKLSLLIATLVAVAGCRGFMTPSRAFDLVIDQPPAVDPLPIRVVDTSAYVQQVTVRQGEVLPPFEGRGGLSNPAGRPNDLVVQWVGGACDERAQLDVSIGGEGRLHLEMRTEVAPGDCDAIGITRALWLSLSVPIDPSEANLDFALK
jgi:hypothetical protein